MNQRVPNTARCLNCRYLLRGLPEPRCPECGHPFDPNDPDSYYDPARPKRSRIRRLVKPVMPNAPHSTSDTFWILLLTAAVIWKHASIAHVFGLHPEASDPCCLALGVPIIYVLLTGVVLDLLWRWRIRAKARRTRDQRILESFERGRRRWRLAIACIVISCVTAVYPWPVYGRFYLSWWSLRREAQAWLAEDRNFARHRRIGLYRVEDFYGWHKGYLFFQVGHRGDLRYGFTYRPNGPPPWEDRIGGRRVQWRWVLPSWYMEAW